MRTWRQLFGSFSFKAGAIDALRHKESMDDRKLLACISSLECFELANLV